MKKVLLFIGQNIYNKRYICGILLFILGLFIINTFHTQFPDEFDNIYGGFLINSGKLPYTGFFTHHNPGAYYLASIITLLSGRSFVLFRIIFAFLLFAGYIASFIFLQKRLGKTSLSFFLFYGVLLGLGSTYWWGHMLLSETVAGYLLVPAFLIILIKKFNNLRIDLLDIWIISLLTFFSLFTSLTYIYLIPIIDLAVIYFYLKGHKSGYVKKTIRPILIFSFPYMLFVVYLLITGSLSEFYFQSIYYNVNYYIYNFPLVAGTYSHHPARYAISIAKHAFDNFYALLTQVNSFNTSYPLNVSLIFGDVAVLAFLLLSRQYSLILLMLMTMVYTNARSEPLNSGEADFHATVYIMISLAAISWFLFEIKRQLNKNLVYFDKLVMSILFVSTSIFWFFSFLSLSSKFVGKAYGKLMGQEPLIYDMPQAAPMINKIVTNNDYFWIGPFELQELLFIKAKVASKYYWFLPADSRDAKIKRELIDDLTKHRPKVIVFKKWWSTFGVNSTDFNTVIVDFLDKNYFQLSDLKKDGINYRVKIANERNFDFEKEFFYDKARKTEIVNDLIEKGLIEKI